MKRNIIYFVLVLVSLCACNTPTSVAVSEATMKAASTSTIMATATITPTKMFVPTAISTVEPSPEQNLGWISNENGEEVIHCSGFAPMPEYLYGVALIGKPTSDNLKLWFYCTDAWQDEFSSLKGYNYFVEENYPEGIQIIAIGSKDGFVLKEIEIQDLTESTPFIIYYKLP